jgi:hypothetical protein
MRLLAVPGGTPVYSKNPSRTQIVVWNGDHLLGGASQFQPPSSNCSWRPIDQSIAGLAEVRTTGEDPSVDTGLDLGCLGSHPAAAPCFGQETTLVAEPPRSAAGASMASPAPLERVVRRFRRHATLRRCSLGMAQSPLTDQGTAPCGRDRARKVELRPVRASLDVRSPSTAGKEMEMEERLLVRVEDARLPLDDAGPSPHVDEHSRIGPALGGYNAPCQQALRNPRNVCEEREIDVDQRVRRSETLPGGLAATVAVAINNPRVTSENSACALKYSSRGPSPPPASVLDHVQRIKRQAR